MTRGRRPIKASPPIPPLRLFFRLATARRDRIGAFATAQALGEPLLDDLIDESVDRVRIYIVLEAPYVPESTPDEADSPADADVIELESTEPAVDRRLDDDGI
jgi:hypothetical protein